MRRPSCPPQRFQEKPISAKSSPRGTRTSFESSERLVWPIKPSKLEPLAVPLGLKVQPILVFLIFVFWTTPPLYSLLEFQLKVGFKIQVQLILSKDGLNFKEVMYTTDPPPRIIFLWRFLREKRETACVSAGFLPCCVGFSPTSSMEFFSGQVPTI